MFGQLKAPKPLFFVVLFCVFVLLLFLSFVSSFFFNYYSFFMSQRSFGSFTHAKVL